MTAAKQANVMDFIMTLLFVLQDQDIPKINIWANNNKSDLCYDIHTIHMYYTYRDDAFVSFAIFQRERYTHCERERAVLALTTARLLLILSLNILISLMSPDNNYICARIY
jgi:hypothetical protein